MPQTLRATSPRASLSVIKKRIPNKFTRCQVIKILNRAAMDKEAEQTGTASGGNADDIHNEFCNTGRIGRRNALPDILGNHCTTTTAELPTILSALKTTDNSTETGTSNAPTTSNTTNGTGMNK